MTEPSHESDLMPPRNPLSVQSIDTDGQADRNHSKALTSPPYQSTMDPSTTEVARDHNENKEGLSLCERSQELTSTLGVSVDSSVVQDGNGHFEEKGLSSNETQDGHELTSTFDVSIDSSMMQDGRDHYENKGVEELSRGNKEYLMLVHTEKGDEQDDVLDSDGKFHDSLDIEGREFGYRTNQDSNSDVSGKDAKETADDQKTNDLTEDGDVFVSSNDKIVDNDVNNDINNDVNNDVNKLSERRTGVAYSPEQIRDIHSEAMQSGTSQDALKQGEVTQVTRTESVSSFQSNSTDNLRNLGYRDSISSEFSLPNTLEYDPRNYHKVSPLPNGVSDSEEDHVHTHTHSEHAKVGRRKTWGSLEFRGFFNSKKRQSSVQRRSSFASRPIKKSVSEVDILCGECEYCVSLPQTNRLLQTQLDKTEKDFKKKEDDLHIEIKELKKENDRQQKLIGQNLTLGPEARIEATMQHEITRLTSENLDLREMIDKQSDQIRKLKKMLKVYSKKLKDGEAAEIQAELEQEERSSANGALATVKHRQRIFLGMLEYKREDEGALLKNLILDLRAKFSSGQIPGLPAYILFMCVRHTDYTNDDEKVRSLLTGTINSIKKVVKKHPDDMERCTMWLANTCRLLHTLKQYSGEKTFQAENTPKQNEQCLRNFDLSEYRQVFSDLAVWVYQGLIKVMQEMIQPNIVPAVLEHEAIAGLTASKPSGLRGRSSSTARDPDEDDSKMYSLDSLMRSLNSFMRIVTQHAVDPELVKQIFRQLYYFICAGALNNLLLRKDMCNWSKGMQIRYNISHLEQWLRDNKLHESGATGTLDTVIQASQLLQARKTDADVESVCEMCSKLTLPQIVKILNLYTPVDEFEERVPISFIRKIQEKLRSREGTTNTLLMETKFSYPVTFPFNPSSIAMETIEVPEQLHLGFLKRI